jgi:hypothetical protein
VHLGSVKAVSLTYKGVTWPRYPAYSGEHLEVEAHRRFAGRGGYMDGAWTPLLNGDHAYSCQTGKWAVSSHDDCGFAGGVRHYCAGGNDPFGIPIPLVAAPPPAVPLPWTERTISASFIGALTHPLRHAIPRLAGDVVYAGGWVATPSDEAVKRCMEALARSRFAWCPRGYGPTSYRLYEAIRLGAIPVYVSDHHWLPEMVPWEQVAIIAHGWDEAVEKMSRLTNAQARDMHRACMEIAPLLSIGAVLDWIDARES